MTRAPFADWQPTPINHDHGGVTRPPHGMVVHTAVGSYQGTINWFKNPAAKVSSYFVVGQDGRLAQCVDLDDRAWTQAAGNTAWIGVENEGDSAHPLTPAQIKANGKILAWLHDHFGVPLQLTTDPVNGRGLGYHSMGGTAWSPAHHNCPGPIIVAQLGEIVAAAKAQEAPVTAYQYDPAINISGIRASIPASITNSPSNTGDYLYTEDGHSYAFDCQDNSHLHLAGQGFWGNRKVAKLLPPTQAEINAGKWFAVIDTAGERYAVPF